MARNDDTRMTAELQAAANLRNGDTRAEADLHLQDDAEADGALRPSGDVNQDSPFA